MSPDDPDVDSLRSEVLTRCRASAVEWRLALATRHYGWADIPGRWIETSPLEDLVDYYTALHELGHVVLGLSGSEGSDVPEVVLEHEARVWLWAFDQATWPPDEDVFADVVAGVDDYNQAYVPEEAPPALVALAHRLSSLGGPSLKLRRREGDEIVVEDLAASANRSG